MTRFYTFALFFAVISSSCQEKSYTSKDNEQATVVKNLNKSDYEAVIAQYAGKTDLSLEERHYLASAYAMKGGMDIYSLYPIMEMELFHKSAFNWDEIKDSKNPYRKFLRETPEFAATDEEREKAWKLYLTDYITVAKMKVKNIESMSFDCDGYLSTGSPEDIILCEFLRDKFDNKIAKIKQGEFELTNSDYYTELDSQVDDELDQYSEKFMYHYNNREFDEPEYGLGHISGFSYSEQEYEVSINGVVVDSFYNIINELSEHNYHVSKIDRKKKAFFLGQEIREMDNSKEMMNFFWKLYESIPLIQRLPKISLEKQGVLTQTLEMLKQNIIDGAYNDKTIKLLVTTFTFSISSIFADSYRLENVDSPFSLPCHQNDEALEKYHPLIRKRMEFIASLRHLDNPSIQLAEDSLKKLEDMEHYLKATSNQLSVQEVAEARLSRITTKIESCDPSVYLYNLKGAKIEM